jgi:hypothetical protein
VKQNILSKSHLSFSLRSRFSFSLSAFLEECLGSVFKVEWHIRYISDWLHNVFIINSMYFWVLVIHELSMGYRLCSLVALAVYRHRCWPSRLWRYVIFSVIKNVSKECIVTLKMETMRSSETSVTTCKPTGSHDLDSEHRGLVVNTPYFGGPAFKCRPGERLFWGCSWFPSVPAGKLRDGVLGHDWFLPHIFQYIIHVS